MKFFASLYDQNEANYITDNFTGNITFVYVYSENMISIVKN